MKPIINLILSIILGVGFFIIPIEKGGKSTVLFDIVVKYITKGFPGFVGWYCLGLVLFGAVVSIIALTSNSSSKSLFKEFKCSKIFLLIRIMGAILAFLMLFQVGPDWLINKKVSGLIWNILVFSVGVIIPIGAVFLNIFISYGFLEFVGTLMRPIMRPLFRLPGRSALDDLTSWLGSYSVGLYKTQKLAQKGYYSRRETFIIVTCFSTVSMGFVGVVASTLGLLNLFPLIFGTYFFVIYFLTIILVRIWPIKNIPDSYLGTPKPEEEISGGFKNLIDKAILTAMAKASSAQNFGITIKEGAIDGLKLASTILGSILTIGTICILVVEYTSIFPILGTPLVPVLKLFGLPDAEILAPASLAGITEMYVPALIAKTAAVKGKFFIAVLSISQLIFFSSVGPMMMDMFKDIPIKFSQLVTLFLLRTAILIPLLALIVNIYECFGVFG